MKFAILHHGGCSGTRFHYRISESGACQVDLPETDPGEHPLCIGIVLQGNADTSAPAPAQLDALRALLLNLKTRFPDIAVGGHRQIRGERTTCPGKHFPLSTLRGWASHELIVERDATFQALVDRQYRL